MGKAQWLGTEKTKNSVENEPLSENFFTNTDVLTGQSILVRESVQNAIDAHLSSSTAPVKMIFKLGVATPSTALKYFADLYPRIEASLGGKRVPNPTDECHYLLIEDFNTTGLLGSTSSEKPAGNGKENSFWYFTWATGTSNKGDGTRGKNGVGKIVFPRSSKIKSQLVYSVRMHEGVCSSIVFGTSLLRMHDFAGKRWAPECRWMSENSSGEHVPFDQEDDIVGFTNDWGVTRQNNATGTSILVPFIDKEFSADKLTQCIIQDYFVAILDGTIECTVVDYDGRQVEITRATIESHLGDLDEDLLTKSSKTKEELLALCNLYLSKLNDDILVIKLAEPAEHKANKWDNFVLTEEQSSQIQNALDAGKSVEFKVPTLVPGLLDSKAQRTLDTFSVLMSRETDLVSMPTFAREGILIPAAGYGSSKYRELLPLVVVSSGELADCLGQAEGPSHEKWSAEETKFREKYVKAQGIELIRFIRDAVSRTVRLFQAQENEPENSHYSKWFPDTDGAGRGKGAEAEGAEKVKKKRRGNGGGGSVALGFAIEKTPTGFRVIPDAQKPAKVGTKAVIKAGYAQFRGGSPLALSSDDFVLKDMDPAFSGVQHVAYNQNHVSFTVQKPDFTLEFSKFDTYRDLVIGVSRAS